MGKRFVLDKCEKNIKNIVMDTRVWRYLETVIINSKIALENIKFSWLKSVHYMYIHNLDSI